MSEAIRSRGEKHRLAFRYYLVDQFGSPVAGDYDLSRYVRGATLRLNADVDVKFQLDLTMEQTPLVNPVTDWVKLLTLDTVGEVTTEYPLGLYRLSMPQEEMGTREQLWQLKGSDRTIQLALDKFTESYTVAAGSNPVAAAIAICIEAGIPERMIRLPSTDKLLQADMTWEQGTAKLRAVNQLLESFGAHSPWADANGYLTSRVPGALESETPARTYQTGEASVVLPPAERHKDDSGIANRVVVRVKNPQTVYSIIATLADSSHPLHPDSLGYTRTNFYDLGDVADVGVAQDYCLRRLEDGLSFYTRATIRTLLDFERAGNAFEVYALDLRDKEGSVLMEGNWRVKGWTMALRTSGAMEHELRRVEAMGGDVDLSVVFLKMDINVFEPLALEDEVAVSP